MTAITLPAKELSWLTRPAFASKKRTVKVEVTTRVYFGNTFWDGGSKNTYRAVRLADGNVASLETGSSPWTAVAEGKAVELEPGIAIVEESIFCGKQMPLRVYLHPSNAAPLLGSNSQLPPYERTHQWPSPPPCPVNSARCTCTS